jgi:hypothetical protein
VLGRLGHGAACHLGMCDTMNLTVMSLLSVPLFMALLTDCFTRQQLRPGF